jgi:predicted O-methyltransferase YrrM
LREPPLVARSNELARELGFERSCEPEVGRLLHALAAQRGRSRVGEIGTGAGVAAAWMVSALAPEVPFVTVEEDARLARAARELFGEDENVTVLEGDWEALLPAEAPFDLLFVDARPAKLAADAVVGLLAPGGTAVLDDFTPGYRDPDPLREAWLGHPRLAAVEVAVSPSMAALLAVRVL